MNNRNKMWLNGIMGVVAGDALGLPVQFKWREELEENPLTDMIGYGTFNMPEGSWSDDSRILSRGYPQSDSVGILSENGRYGGV